MDAWVQWAVPVGLIAGFLLFKRVGQVGRDEAHKLVKDGAALVDVRSPAEFSSGHLPGAINIPVGDLGGQVKKLGKKDGPIVLYCASGTRSMMARSTLKGLGYTKVFNLGPMSRW